MENIQLLPFHKLTLDGSTQLRAALDQDMILDISLAVREGDEIEPGVAFWDGKTYWPADGHHRIEGHKKAGKKEMRFNVVEGSQRDAILYAAGANRKNATRTTAADKQKAIHVFLADPEWSQWSDRRIAAQCGCTHPTVAEARTQLVNFTSCDETTNGGQSQEEERTGMDGKKRKARKPKELKLCDRCKKVGIQKDCIYCAELRGTKGKAGRKKASSNGEAIATDLDWEKTLGSLIRMTDQWARHAGQLNKAGKVVGNPAYAGLNRKLGELLKEGKAYRKECMKPQKQPK